MEYLIISKGNSQVSFYINNQGYLGYSLRDVYMMLESLITEITVKASLITDITVKATIPDCTELSLEEETEEGI